ncbi:hypothetical protein WA026_019378, partial [Henosepilachna vigintioctopunctata]
MGNFAQVAYHIKFDLVDDLLTISIPYLAQERYTNKQQERPLCINSLQSYHGSLLFLNSENVLAIIRKGSEVGPTKNGELRYIYQQHSSEIYYHNLSLKERIPINPG